MRQPIYVGIDQSYDGLAIVALSRNGEYTHSLTRWPAHKYGAGISRLESIFDHVLTWLSACSAVPGQEIEHVCMEGYAAGAKFGREKAGELGATVKAAVWAALAPRVVAFPTIVPPSSLKKFVTGKGNATKDLILKSVYKKWGADFDDNNLADAYGLARVALSFDEENLLGYERDAISNLTRNTERWNKPSRQKSTTSSA